MVVISVPATVDPENFTELHRWFVVGDDLSAALQFACLSDPVVTITSIILTPVKSRRATFC